MPQNYRTKNWRNAEITTGSGRNVKDTKIISGEATGSELKGRNKLQEHRPAGPPIGEKGGKNRAK